MNAFGVCLLLATGWPSAADAPLPAQIEKQALAATVRIYCTDVAGMGSGVVICVQDSFAYVLTANHVIAGAKKLKMVAKIDGQPVPFEQHFVLWGLDHPDLALVRFAVGPEKIAFAPLGQRGKRALPLAVWCVGWDKDGGPTAESEQALKRLDVRHPKHDYVAFFWQVDGLSREGRSGGGMFSNLGELLGICSGNQGKNSYYVHLDEIHAAIRKSSSSSFLLPKDVK